MGRPFARASALFAMIAAAMALGEGLARTDALGAVPAYRSRGKGGKRPQRPTGIAGVKRAALKARNQQRNRMAHA